MSFDRKAYRNTPAAKEARRLRDATPQARAKARAATKARYHANAEYRAKVIERSRAFYATPEGKAVERARRTSFLGRFRKYRHGARARALGFTLTEEQFASFWQKPCTYCLVPIDTIGLDRVDSSVGYTMSNVVSCCEVCNRMKLTWGREFFVEHCKRVARVAEGEPWILL